VSRRLLAAGATAAALLVAGCGDKQQARTVSAQTTTTRVEVLQDAGDPKAHSGSFDPSAIYQRESPGVVTIISTGLDGANGPTATPGGGGGQSGLGSGFVISGQGEIATNAHVVTSGEGADIRKADQVYVRFKDDNQVPARIVGFDPFSDVALLRVDPAGLTLRPLPLGSAGDLSVGSPVAAIGSPFGEDQSLSVGVISALDRSIQSLTGFATVGAIQTDAAINHGNSGGPLLDARGRVLGINAQIQTTTGDGSGVGFAVSVDTVKRSLSQLRRDGKARYSYLGVTTSPVFPQLAEHFGLKVDHGAWVQAVSPGGPSERAGLKAGDRRERFQDSGYVAGGDVIVSVGGHPVREEDDVAQALVQLAPGTTVELAVMRGDARKTLRVKLGERPLDAPRAG
jgi:S1-C subfamily serine protease